MPQTDHPDALPPPLPPAAGLPAFSPDAGESEQADHHDNVIPTEGYRKLPVVGLGGSAGSFQALCRFFENTPASTGSAYVVVVHLSPDHASLLPELLQRHAAIPVRVATDDQAFEADHAYVIPPGKHLVTTDGRLQLKEMQPEFGRRVAVDLFFRSLADTHGPHATAVVLSGADGDGTIGLKRIKERGGLTIAQDAGEAEYPSMPSAAIATGMVDWVLPAADMPKRIAAYVANGLRLPLPFEAEEEQQTEMAPPPAPPGVPAADQAEALLREVLAFVRTQTGRDFSYYKRGTVVRRIARRMQLCDVGDLAAYLAHLRTHPGESDALLQDLLISVTNFFRDREAFQALELHMVEIFRGKTASDSVRVWCAACATGEETYSMAMLLLEHAGRMEAAPTLQVFGCDLNEQAIQVARAGLYPEAIAADVSQERLRRFFTKEPGGWRVRRELREMVLFTSHDLLKDAPFSRMDLVSCRNLLIYLNRDAQARALDLFNFALRPGGLLFLGASESVDDGKPLFAPLDKQHRLYVNRQVHRLGLPFPIGGADSTIQRVIAQHDRLQHAAPATLPSRAFVSASVNASFSAAVAASVTAFAPGGARLVGRDGRDIPADALHFALLDRFCLASLVVDGAHDIVHLSANAHPFLQMPPGEPTRNLLRMVHPRLRSDLRAALLRAAETGEPVDMARLLVDLPIGRKAVEVHVVPAGDLSPNAALVTFEAHEPGEEERGDGAAVRAPLEPGAVVEQLERELTRANAHLRANIEQHEASVEELRASNEELQAMNEELRSAGEELETGREELQSLNEELTTVNTEFKNRVEELARTNSDLHNLMSATQIATVFLDRDLQVMRYTPSAAPLFNFIAGDVGRPISHLNRRLDYPELLTDAEQVLRTLVPVERELRENGHWYLARVLPYRTIDDHIGGVVLTFVDITDRRNAETALRASEAWLTGQNEAFQAAVRDAPLAASLEPLVRIAAARVSENARCAFYLADRAGANLRHVAGLSDVYDAGVDAFRIGGDSPACGLAAHIDRPVITPDVAQEPRWAPWRWLADRHGFRACWSFPVEIEQKAIGTFAMYFEHPREATQAELDFALALTRVAAVIVSRSQETAERASAERAQRESEERLRLIMEASNIATWEWDLASDEVYWNDQHFRLFGMAPRPQPLRPIDFFGHVHPDDRQRVEGELQRANEARETFQSEFRAVTDAGEQRWMSGYGRVVREHGGRATRMSGTMVDVTERKHDEQALLESRERLHLIVENAREYAIIAINPQRRITSWNSGAEHIVGYTQAEALGQPIDVIYVPEDREAGVSEQEAIQAQADGRAEDDRWHVRKDGSRFWGAGLLTAMQDANGASIGFVKIFRDQTAGLHAKEALEQSRAALSDALRETEAARDEAQLAGQAKDRFLAVLSHELRTPLTPLLIAVQVLMRNEALPAQVHDTLDVIRRNARLETQLVDDLLDVTRIATGKVELHRVATALRDVVHSAIDVASPDFVAKRQQLTVELVAGDDALFGDVKRLQQVVWNLLKNASKFTPSGGTIAVRSHLTEGHATLEVSDSGVGFELRVAERIFGAFEQGGPAVTREFGGLGLGLAIARASVEAHGGTIRAFSAGAGRGATFTIELPLARAG